jgi:pSer/pThr/pTyr-binding forkhead associated (FHA) protein
MAIILIIKEKDKRHEVTLEDQAFVIGRSRKSDLKINDAKMSGRHCSIKLSGGRAFIKDLESTNGTYINNKKVQQSPLYIDDVVKVGDTTLFLNKKKMNAGEQALHTSSSRDAMNQRLSEDQSTSSQIQQLREARKARAQQKRSEGVPEHIKAQKAIGNKKKKDNDGFAVLTRILKIK